MDSLLVVGIDTIVGANFAASLADRYRVSTWANSPGYEIANTHALDPADAPRQLIATCQPQRIVYCGAASRSNWELHAATEITDQIVAEASDWAAAAQEQGIPFVMISSDAVFTGPWMFHDEESPGQCRSRESQAVLAAEQQVLRNCPAALIIRSNVFGWSAVPQGLGWIESILHDIETRRFVQQDHIRHATPILATDLVDIVERAWREEVAGIYHVAGAERCSPLKFAQRLADQFDLPWLAMRKETELNEPPQGFGEGECSLQTKKIRKELCVAMPLLSEGLSRLFEQSQCGYREQLCPSAAEAIRKQSQRAA